MDKDMVYYDNDRAYPGLIVMAKFFKDIKHKGSEDWYEYNELESIGISRYVQYAVLNNEQINFIDKYFE